MTKPKRTRAEIDALLEKAKGSGDPLPYQPDDLKKKNTPKHPGMTKEGRVRFTTMLKPEIRAALRKIADNTGGSVADVIEAVLEDFLSKIQGK